MISISIVSHGHWALVQALLDDLERYCADEPLEILLTLNTRAEHQARYELSQRLTVHVVENPRPLGFGENHNRAFERSQGDYFLVLNPDIRLLNNPFPPLLDALVAHQGAVIAPTIVDSQAVGQDSMRSFPTLWGLTQKALGINDGQIVPSPKESVYPVEWLAGMFMLFTRSDFERVGGFDEGFFLYYEDVDICVRLWQRGRTVLGCRTVQVIHDAQRASRRDWRFMRWHAASMARYFYKHLGRLPRV